jgi:DNA recombination protein RmuC
MELLYIVSALFLGLALGIFIGKLMGKASSASAQTENLILKERVQKLENEGGVVSQKFQEDFSRIANQILVDGSRKVNADAQQNFATLLNPLQSRLGEFQKAIEQNVQEQKKDSGRLEEKLRQLTEINQTLGSEAKRLTEALRGESKTRGNWGELVLEKILEASGLRRDKEYKIQVSLKGEEGRFKPDVVVYLPDNKNVVIDSKVSLVHFEKLGAADANREELLKSHAASVRTHIKGLAEKGYEGLEGLNTPDFVFMFIPIEAAFLEAMNHDPEIYEFAFQKKIILLSPATLLAALKLVQNIWRQEEQNKNSREIAKQGAVLFDKFAGFVDDLQKVGNQLDTTKKTYDEAMKKLSSGRGNLVGAAEKLKELGVQPGKRLSISGDGD